MKIMKESAHKLARLMRKINASTEDGIVVGLMLGTEENIQEFFAWYKSLTKEPTPQECFEEALEIAGIKME